MVINYGLVSRYHTGLLMLKVLRQQWVDRIDSAHTWTHVLHLIHSVHIEHSICVLAQLIFSVIELIPQLT